MSKDYVPVAALRVANLSIKVCPQAGISFDSKHELYLPSGYAIQQAAKSNTLRLINLLLIGTGRLFGIT